MSIAPTSFEQASAIVDRLVAHKISWLQISLEQRIDYLQRCIPQVLSVAEPWVEKACSLKGIDPATPLAGEEWLSGPMALVRNLRLLIQSLQAQGQPRPPRTRIRPDGQVVAEVFPDTLMDRLIWSGMSAEVWLEPGKPAAQGAIYRNTKARGQLCLVLGAGNISSIGVMDALYKLFVENQVVILKFNPVNEQLGPYLKQALQPLQEAGFFDVVYGGPELGQFLCHHPEVNTLHITGSHYTHDAIVWGKPEEQAARKANQTPLLDKPITSELGCVTPVLVVPGDWSAAELSYQARQLASMVVHNASFNCNAAKVLVMAAGWPQRSQFLALLQQFLAEIPPRQAYYPGAQERYQAFLDRYPQAVPLGVRTPDVVPWTLIPEVPPQPGEYALTQEAFCGVLAEVSLPVQSASEFLPQAVKLANDRIWGSLSCMIMIDPRTERQCRVELEQAIADLRYGGISINAWSALIYGLCVTTWGAFPGNPLTDIGSGRGVVHNTYLFDYPQKSVARAPFRLPVAPPWFAGHRTLKALAQRLLRFEANPTWSQLPAIILTAVQG